MLFVFAGMDATSDDTDTNNNGSDESNTFVQRNGGLGFVIFKICFCGLFFCSLLSMHVSCAWKGLVSCAQVVLKTFKIFQG